MKSNAIVTTKSELTEGNGRLSRVIEFHSGEKVEIPINKDGSVKWYDDERLQKEK